MNNIKKTALGVLVAALAFGFSAFKIDAKLDSAIYYQTEDGTYEKAEPNGTCGTPSEDPCAYFFSIDPEVTSFASDNVPLGGVPTPDGDWVYTEPTK